MRPHGVVVFLVAFGFVLALEAYERPASGSLHWGSEELIQTLPLADLAAEPLRSLWYLHVQPPGLEILRLCLAAVSPSTQLDERIRWVDGGLTFAWAAVFGGLVTLTAHWLRRLVPVPLAVGTAALLALHPGAMLFATVPDTTLLTALLVTWSSYELWRTSPASGSPARLAAAFLCLFFVRSIFQWPALVVFALAIALRGAGARRLLLFLVLTAPVVAGYTVKQYMLFHLTTATSFAGYNCLRSLGMMPWGFDRGQLLAPPSGAGSVPVNARAARVLSTELKSSGVQNFNHAAYLAANGVLLEACRREFAVLSWGRLLSIYAFNARLYLWPSSRYASAQPVLAHAVWRPMFDWMLSGPRFVLLVLGAVLVWLLGWNDPSGLAARSPAGAGRGLLAGFGLALPLLMVAAASVLFERGENMRFRFFLEPVALVFVGAQLHALRVRLALARARSSHSR